MHMMIFVGVALFAMNRPEAKNAMNKKMVHQVKSTCTHHMRMQGKFYRFCWLFAWHFVHLCHVLLQLNQAIDIVKFDSQVRVVILCSEAPGVFCAGL